MTLYWYLHWFWITGVFYVSSSNMRSSTISSISEESLKVMKKPPNHDHMRSNTSIKFDNVSSPVHPESGISVKHKFFLKKHLGMPPLPPKNVTNSTIVGDKGVINTNTSNPINGSEHQKYLFSGILNPFNHSSFNDSLMYLEEEHSNASIGSDFKQAASSNGSQFSDNLSAAGITGITLGCVSIVGIISALSYILYRNRGFNRPQVLNDHCSNLDSSGYIDDTSVRDNSEEMYSLDNDSFLNSLEAMTIQNYWMDTTVKHTKL